MEYSGEQTLPKELDQKVPNADGPRPTSSPASLGISRTWSIIISLAYANFWMAAAVSIQAPFFPLEAELKGATPTEYGFVFGVFELVVVLVTPLYGKLIPRISPKFLITTGLLVGGAACALFGVLEYSPPGKVYIALCFVVRIFEGAGAAAAFTASFTIIAAAFPDLIGTGFSLKQTAFSLGLIAGPTIGGALYGLGGFYLPFVVNGLFLLLGCALLIFILPNVEDPNPGESSSQFIKFMGNVDILLYTSSIATSFLVIGYNSATLEPHLRQFNLRPEMLGVVFMVNALLLAVGTPICGWLCDNGVYPMAVNVFGYLCTCAGILFIGPVPFFDFKESVGSIVTSLAVIGLGMAAKLSSAFAGTMQNAAERGFPENLATYGIVSALISTACSLGAFIGPSLGGWLLDSVGYKMSTVVVFAIDGFFFLPLIACAIVKVKRRTCAGGDEVTPILLSYTDQSQMASVKKDPSPGNLNAAHFGLASPVAQSMEFQK